MNQRLAKPWRSVLSILLALLIITLLIGCREKKGGHKVITQSSPLVAHWTFDEGKGDTAADSVDGHLMVLHSISWTQGKSGTALKFDGSSSYGEVSDSDRLDLVDAFTIVAWINLPEIGTGRQVLLEKKDATKGDNSTNYALYVQWTYDALALVIGDGHRRVGYLSDRGLGTASKWHHIAVTFGNGKVQFYIDGEPAGVDASTIKPLANEGPLIVGRYTGSDGKPRFGLEGSLDDLRIYNKALTSQEIKKLFEEGNS